MVNGDNTNNKPSCR